MRYYPKRLDVAKVFFEMVLKANKKDIETLNILGGLYKEGLNDYKKALECYDTVLEVDPKNKEALNEKAYVFIHYFPKNEIDKAITVLEEAVGYYPNDYNIKVWLADALMYKNTVVTFAKGVELLEEAIAHTPNKSFAWVIYGNRIWITAQKPVEAEQIYKDGLKHNPYSCALMGNLAELYDNVYQDYDQAAKYYKEDSLQSFSQ
jgi:tetratricopeptide (TPR) repeat protein